MNTLLINESKVWVSVEWFLSVIYIPRIPVLPIYNLMNKNSPEYAQKVGAWDNNDNDLYDSVEINGFQPP